MINHEYYIFLFIYLFIYLLKFNYTDDQSKTKTNANEYGCTIYEVHPNNGLTLTKNVQIHLYATRGYHSTIHAVKNNHNFSCMPWSNALMNASIV